VIIFNKRRRNRTKTILLCVIISFLFIAPLETYSGNRTKTIVIFFSLHANLPAYQNLLEGFRTTFSEEYHQPYNLLIEYLDIGRLTDDKYAKYIIEQYNEKFKGSNIDLLITVTPGIIPVLEKYGLDAVKKSPTISIVLDSLSADQGLFKADNIVEITVKFKFARSVQAACDLFPDRKNIYIISGSSPTDNYFTSKVRSGIKSFEKAHKVVYITGLSLDSTLQIARKIPDHSIVIVPTYLSDNKKIQFSTPEIIGLLATNCNSPVFPLFDSFIKREGGIGGYVFSYNELGRETGRVASRVLNGMPLKKINVKEDNFYQNIFDWRVLKKWDLLGSKALPSNSIYYYQQHDFVTDYKWYILAGVLFLILESLLIVYLYKLNVRQKAIVKQKTEVEDLYRILIREDRLLTMVELTASLSHELNQPLTAILYNAQAGMRFLKSEKLDSTQAEEIFKNIIEDDKRAAELISSVKSLMKLEYREMGKINLNSLIQDTIPIFNSEAIKKQIQLKLTLNRDPVYVFGDRIQLQQVILNLISNAAIAMEETDTEHKIIEIRELVKKGSVTVSVCDFGPGISDSMKENLFKPFVTSRKSGFGIGLAVSRSIIEKHQGTMRAGNIPGGGAEFSFSLMVVKDD